MRPAAVDRNPDVTGSSARTGMIDDFLRTASGFSWEEARRQRRRGRQTDGVVCEGSPSDVDQR